MIQDDIDGVVLGLVGLNPWRREIIIPLSLANFTLYVSQPNKAVTTTERECIFNSVYNDNLLVVRIVWNDYGESPVTSEKFYLNSPLGY